MKEYIHNFNTEQEYQDYINGEYEEPFVGGVRTKENDPLNKIVFNNNYQKIYTTEEKPLTFEILSDGVLI